MEEFCEFTCYKNENTIVKDMQNIFREKSHKNDLMIIIIGKTLHREITLIFECSFVSLLEISLCKTHMGKIY
jgi:hypothetical protein